MSKFGEYVQRLDVAITGFLRSWEESPAKTRTEHLLYITLARSILLSIDQALERHVKEPEMTETAVSHLVTTAVLMADISDQLLVQLAKVIEIH